MRYLGRKAELPQMLRGVAELEPPQRGAVGKAANEARQALEALIEQRARGRCAAQELERELRRDALDVTLPGAPPQPIGAPARAHAAPGASSKTSSSGSASRSWRVPRSRPCTTTSTRSTTAPRIPRARAPTPSTCRPELVLRTHTSPMQVRAMEAHPPPLYVVIPGRVYRPDSDATHTPQFHQIEGLAVDEDITLADLKGTLLEFARAVFGDERDVRLRPHFFPFTEPSVEVDVSCFHCDGQGLPGRRRRAATCARGRAGWRCSAPARSTRTSTRTYPRPRANAPGYDPEQVQGFAWGLGVERIAMLKHGIPDLRLLLRERPALPGAVLMRVPLPWLREYCDPPLDARAIEERLTMTGTKVEAIHHHGVRARPRGSSWAAC